MTYKTLVRPHGFTLVELLVTIAVIAVLINLAMPAAQKLQQSASAALQFPGLQPVAANVRQLTCGQDSAPPTVLQSADAASIPCGQESPLGNALADAEALVSTVQDTQQPPDPQVAAETLQELQAVEAQLRQDLGTLDNPASAHVGDELEAYLDLKRDLQDVVEKVHVTEMHVKKLVDVASVKLN